MDDATPRLFTRRGALGLGAGALLTIGAGGVVRGFVYSKLRWEEDFFPGSPPDIRLEPEAWTTSPSSVTFAVLGDNGSGGRNQMAVAAEMARTYRRQPYGLVLLVGDISYYGSIDDRWEEVFVEPYGPLIDAGVRWELAIGNHELEEQRSEDAAAEVEAQLRRFGKPGTYYSAVHGPMEVFVLDSSTPLVTGRAADEQLAWLEGALAASTAPWKVAMLHHPAFSSGSRGSNLAVREAVQPLLAAHGVQVAFSGHDHHYERTTPQDGVTWVVSGAGSKRSPVGSSEFTAFAASRLQFMWASIEGGEMDLRCIGTDGRVIDRVTLPAGRAP